MDPDAQKYKVKMQDDFLPGESHFLVHGWSLQLFSHSGRGKAPGVPLGLIPGVQNHNHLLNGSLANTITLGVRSLVHGFKQR